MKANFHSSPILNVLPAFSLLLLYSVTVCELYRLRGCEWADSWLIASSSSAYESNESPTLGNTALHAVAIIGEQLALVCDR